MCAADREKRSLRLPAGSALIAGRNSLCMNSTWRTALPPGVRNTRASAWFWPPGAGAVRCSLSMSRVCLPSVIVRGLPLLGGR